MELFKKLNLIYAEEGNCFKIAGFENMVGSETGWAKQKREQREKQKLQRILTLRFLLHLNKNIFTE